MTNDLDSRFESLNEGLNKIIEYRLLFDPFPFWKRVGQMPLEELQDDLAFIENEVKRIISERDELKKRAGIRSIEEIPYD